MKTNFLSLLLIVAIITGACKKNPDKGLTPETQTGANTFSCKINGEIFVPAPELLAPDPLSVQGGTYFGTPILKIYAANSKSYVKAISFDFRKFKGKGYYTADSSKELEIEFRLNIPSPDSRIAESGFVNITRYDNNIVAGTFEFYYNKNNENINVLQGRFDLKLN